MINKKTNLKEAVDKYPEVASVLAQAGLHCIGCHSSANETIEEGCKAHGFDDSQIDALLKDANKRIKEFDSLPQFELTKKAIEKLKENMKKEKGKYVRLLPVFNGFDFDAVDEKYEHEIELDKGVPILISSNLERFLRGVIIDYSSKEKDFTAKRK